MNNYNPNYPVSGLILDNKFDEMSDDELKKVNEARLCAHYWRQKSFAMYSALCQATGQKFLENGKKDEKDFLITKTKIYENVLRYDFIHAQNGRLSRYAPSRWWAYASRSMMTLRYAVWALRCLMSCASHDTA